MNRNGKRVALRGLAAAMLAASGQPLAAGLLVYEGFDTGVAVETPVAGAGLGGATSVGFAAGSAWDAVATNGGAASHTAAGLSFGGELAVAGGALRVQTGDALSGTGVNAYRQSGVTVADGATLYGSFLYRPEATVGRFTAVLGVESGYGVKFDGTPLAYGAHRLGDNDDAYLFTFQPDSFNSANNNFTGGMKVRRFLSGSFASVDSGANPLPYAAGETYLGVWKITNVSGYATAPDGSSADPTLTAQSATFWVLTRENLAAARAAGLSEAALDAHNIGRFVTTQDAFRAQLVASNFINIAGLSGGSSGNQAGTFDEIRMGATLESVLPVPPPAPAPPVVTQPMEVWWGSYRFNEQLVDAGAGQWPFVQAEMDGYLLHGAYWNYTHMSPSPNLVGPKLAAILNAHGKPVILEHLLAGLYPNIDSPFGYSFAGNLTDAAGFGSAISNIKRLMGYGFPRPDISSDFIMNAWQEAVRWHPRWTRKEFFTALTGSWETYAGDQFDTSPGSLDRQRYGWFRQWVERLADAFPGIRVTATNSPVYFPWEEDGVVRRELGGSLNNFFTWLKLERRGDQVTALYSGDGFGWAELGTATVPLGATPRAGLLAASGAAGLAEARFDNLRFLRFFLTDIGRPGRGGAIDVLNDPIGRYTLQANGNNDLHPGNNTFDAQFYAYREWSGDGEFIVRLDSLTGSNPGRTNGAAEKPTAGITLRASTAANARQVSLHATLANTLEFRARTAIGGGLANVAGSGSPIAGAGVASGARWLRLTRAGNSVAAAHSTDGASWTSIGAVTVDLGAAFLVGLVADSQVSFERATAAFTQVNFLSAPSSAFSGATIGAAGAASSTLASGVYTLKSAGDGVAGTGDSMRFHSAELPGDGTLYARLQYFADAANPDLALAAGAQMGVALRASTAADAPQLAAVFTPKDGLRALARSAPGAAVALAGAYGAGETGIEPLGAQRRPLLHYFTGNDYLGTLHEAFPGAYAANYAGFTTDSPYAGYQKWGGSETHPDALAHRRKIILYERWLHSVGREHQFIANSAGGTDFNAFDTGTQAGRDGWDLLYKEQSLRSIQLHQLEGGRPDMVIFESWYSGPYTLVPESKEGSFTNLVRDGIRYVKGTGQVLDLAVAPAGAGSFAGEGVQQLEPAGVQRVFAAPGAPGAVQEWTVRLRNEGDVGALPVLHAHQTGTAGWGIAYAIGATDVTAAITSPDGLVVTASAVRGQELVAPGAAVDLRVILTSPAAPPPGSILIRAFWNPQDPSLAHRDAVRIELYEADRYAEWAAGIDWKGADSSPGADPDRDSLPNLLEYALGGDPLVPDPAVAPQPALDGGFLTISFDRVDDPDLTYTVMGSSDLTAWAPVWESTGAQNTAGRVTVTDPVAVAAAGSRFLMLAVTLAGR